MYFIEISTVITLLNRTLGKNFILTHSYTVHHFRYLEITLSLIIHVVNLKRLVKLLQFYKDAKPDGITIQDKLILLSINTASLTVLCQLLLSYSLPSRVDFLLTMCKLILQFVCIRIISNFLNIPIFSYNNINTV